MATRLFGQILFTATRTHLLSPTPTQPVQGVVEIETPMHDKQEALTVKSIIDNTLSQGKVGGPKVVVESLIEALKARYPRREIRVIFQQVRAEYKPDEEKGFKREKQVATQLGVSPSGGSP